MLDLNERSALRSFLEVETPLQRALVTFLNEQITRYEGDCSGYMASVPRDHERASDAASHADAYRTWLPELKHYAQQQRD